MPLPLLFIGVAAATGGLGAGKAIKAGVDASHAKRINRSANEIVETSTAQLNAQRFACGKALRQLGEEKLFVLNHSISAFLDTFSKILESVLSTRSSVLPYSLTGAVFTLPPSI